MLDRPRRPSSPSPAGSKSVIGTRPLESVDGHESTCQEGPHDLRRRERISQTLPPEPVALTVRGGRHVERQHQSKTAVLGCGTVCPHRRNQRQSVADQAARHSIATVTTQLPGATSSAEAQPERSFSDGLSPACSFPWVCSQADRLALQWTATGTCAKEPAGHLRQEPPRSARRFASSSLHVWCDERDGPRSGKAPVCIREKRRESSLRLPEPEYARS